MTGSSCLGIALVVLSYREVVTVYTGRAAVRGPKRRVAQVAAGGADGRLRGHGRVQNRAGSAAIPVDVPGPGQAAGDAVTLTLIAVIATLIMCYVNLRG